MEHGLEWKALGTAPDGFLEFALIGDCDLYNAPAFMRDMAGKLTAGAARLRFDCAGLRYLDSTGVGAIIKLLQAAKAQGGELRFTGLMGTPRKVRTLCNVISLIKEDRRDAARI
jgi:anti-sigma B factor antagonist